jgi:hypothetical protein
MFANLRLVWWQLLAYLAVATVLAFVGQLVGDEPTGLVGLVLYFAGQYWLFRSLLKARGLVETPRIHIFAFVGLAAVLIFPIMFGVGLFVLPGLFLVARYIAAPSYIVARGDGAFAAAINSWRAVRGHTLPIAGAAALIFIGVSLIGGLIGGIGGLLAGLGTDRAAEPIDVIELQLIPLLLFALSTATYELLGPQDNSIEEVFG